MTRIKSNLMLFLLIFSEIKSKWISAAPQSNKVSHTWPYLPTYDIWGSGKQQTKKLNQTHNNQTNLNRFNNINSIELVDVKKTVYDNFKKSKDTKLMNIDSFRSSNNKTSRRNSKGEYLFYIFL